MATFNAATSDELRNAIQLAMNGDIINLTSSGPYSVGTLSKLTCSNLPTNSGRYQIIGVASPKPVINDTRIYQDNIDGYTQGPSLVQNVTLNYTGAAANNTSILRSTSGTYVIDGVDFTGQHGGWSGNSSVYISLTVCQPSTPNNASLTFKNSKVSLSGQTGFNGTNGGAAFMQSWNNSGTVVVDNNMFDEGSVANGGYYYTFHFYNSPSVAPTAYPRYTINNNTFFRSVNQNVRDRGNRLENVQATLTGNTFSNGSYLDLMGNSTGVTFGNGTAPGNNTFNTIANGYGIRISRVTSGGVSYTGSPTFTGTTTFTGPGLALKYVSNVANTNATLNGTFVIGGNTFDRLIAGGQVSDTTGLTGSATTRDWIFGDAGNDGLNGSNLADSLDGGTGDDSLVGGPNGDTLTGGTGSDIFRYQNRTDGNDIITDFSNADNDKFLFQSTQFGGLTNGSITAANLIASASPVPVSAIPTFLYNTTSGQLSFDVDGTGGTAANNLAILQGTPTLTYTKLTFF